MLVGRGARCDFVLSMAIDRRHEVVMGRNASARIKLPQRVEQSFRLLQIRNVEALSEPAMDLRYELARLRALSLFLP